MHNRPDVSVERTTERWFGFKGHTIVDKAYELPLAFEVTPASTAEQPVAITLLKQLKDNQPLILETGEYFMADRGNDEGKLHRQLWDVPVTLNVVSARACASPSRKLDGLWTGRP